MTTEKEIIKKEETKINPESLYSLGNGEKFTGDILNFCLELKACGACSHLCTNTCGECKEGNLYSKTTYKLYREDEINGIDNKFIEK